MKPVTWPQATIILALLGAPLVAHYLGGQAPSGVAGAVATILAWLMSSPLQKGPTT